MKPFSAFNVPIAICVPGTNGKVANPSTCPMTTAFNLNAAYIGLPPVQVFQNTPYGDSDYYTWEITANKRQTGRWSLLASFSETWNYAGPVALATTTTTASTPNALINTINGRNVTRTWSAKISSTMDAPFGVRLTPMWRHQSGIPFGATFKASLNFSSGVPILVEPTSSERLSNINLVDLRMQKNINVKKTKVGVFFDAYNIFNTNVTQQVTQSYGNTFMRPTVITAPRIFRIGARYDF